MKLIKIKLVFTFCLALACLAAGTQQTSTDTSWRVKAQQQGKKNIPQYPKLLTVSQDGSGNQKG